MNFLRNLANLTSYLFEEVHNMAKTQNMTSSSPSTEAQPQLAKQAVGQGRRKGRNMSLSDRLDALPFEIRSEIYSYLLPDSYSQSLPTYPVSGIFGLVGGIGLPPCLAVSSKLQTNAWPHLMDGRVAEISISAAEIITNFPVREPGSTLVIKDNVKLPFCASFDIALHVPSPRRAADVLSLRRNVGLLVKWLNAWLYEEIPIIRISILDKATVCVNDFTTLAGPLIKLSKACKAIHISVTPEFARNKKLSERCAITEMVLNGRADKGDFIYQQLILDVKLPLCVFIEEETNNWGRYAMAPKDMSKCTNDEIGNGLVALRNFCAEHRIKEHSWIERMIQFGAVPTERTPEETMAVFQNVIGPYSVGKLSSWAAGFLTAYDPFLSEEIVERKENPSGVAGMLLPKWVVMSRVDGGD